MNDQYDGNGGNRQEEPERVYIPYPPNPGSEPVPGGGFGTTALIFSILSILLSGCLAPISIVLSILSFVWLRRYREAGGEARGSSVAAALLAGLGIVFAVLTVILIAVAFITKDPNSIYGYLYQLEA